MVLVLGLSGEARAERFTFDDPGYVAGQRAPNPPWLTGAEWKNQVPTTLPLVVAAQGVGGSQCLSLLHRPDSEGTSHASAIYVFPRRLTRADGAQRVSVKYAPPRYLGADNGGSLFFGEVALGGGTGPSTDYRAVYFRALSGESSTSPTGFRAHTYRAGSMGVIDGGPLGDFVPGGGFYELIFDISADWTEITSILVTPSGDRRTVVQPHDPDYALEWLILDGSIEWPEFGVFAEPVLYDDVTLPDISARIAQQPRNQMVRPGWTITFEAATDGTLPLQHQWWFNGNPLPGETSPTLTVANVQAEQAGSYRLVVNNSFSSAESRAATLTLTNPPALESGTVVVWGDTSQGQADVPAGLQATAVALGWQHCLALRPDGTVVAWGGNGFGQANVPPDLNDVTAIAAGAFHSLAVRRDGTGVSWGDGPVGFPGGTKNVLNAAGGWAYSLAVTSDGSIVASENAFAPTLSEPAAQVATGDYYSLALTEAGTVTSWANADPSQITKPEGLSGVQAIAGGGSYWLALKSDGTVVSWGALTEVPAGLSDVTAVAAGSGHSLALRADGSVAGWGDNSAGQITLPSGMSRALAISACGTTSAAIVRGGSVTPDPARFTRIAWKDGGVELEVASQAGIPCRVEFSSDLQTWNLLATQTPDQPQWTLRDSGADSGPRFYRAVFP